MKVYDFELHIELKGTKNPSEIFNHLSGFYNKLLVLDRHIVYNISVGTIIKYNLVAIETTSVATKVKQILINTPINYSKNGIETTTWLPDLLVHIKCKILRVIALKQVSSRKDLDKLTDEINRKIKKEIPSYLLFFSVNNYFILNIIKEISIQASELKRGDYLYFKSAKNKVKLTNRSLVDISKIVDELEKANISQEIIEILKIKTIDLSSNISCWKFKRAGEFIDVKITDEAWLEQYYNRKFVIQPNDYLKINLKIIHTMSSNTQKTTVIYQAIKVISIIPPNHIENNGQLEIPY